MANSARKLAAELSISEPDNASRPTATSPESVQSESTSMNQHVDRVALLTGSAMIPASNISSLQKLIAAHEVALAEFDASTDNYDMDNDTQGHAVDATRDAILAHRPTTLEEIHAKAKYMAKTKTFAEWDNFDQKQLIEALTPSEAMPSVTSDPLAALIDEYRTAHDAYNATPFINDKVDKQTEDMWMVPYTRLNKNPPHATTLEGAIAAVRLVRDEEQRCGNQPDLTVNVLTAALVYFEDPSHKAERAPETVEIADAELIELGHRFEKAMAEARALELERCRLFKVYEQEAEAKDISDDHCKESHRFRRQIMKSCGYTATTDAFAKKHSEAVRLMKAIYRQRPTTLAGFAVFTTAVVFDQFDFEVNFLKPGFAKKAGADVAEKQLLRLVKFIRDVSVKGSVSRTDEITTYRSSPIMALFAEWHTALLEVDEVGRECSAGVRQDADLSPAVDKLSGLLRKLTALRSVDGRDLAAKLSAITQYGEYMDLNGWVGGPDLVREAAAVVGHADEVRLGEWRQSIRPML